MARDTIPNPIIAVVSKYLADAHSHSELNTLFLANGAPGMAPPGNKVDKCVSWLQQSNFDASVDMLRLLGGTLEQFMEVDRPPGELQKKRETERNHIVQMLGKYNFTYRMGGRIEKIVTGVPESTSVPLAAPSPSSTVSPVKRDVLSMGGSLSEPVARVVPVPRDKPKVFVIHGHDPNVVHAIEALLHRIGCEPLIFSRIPKDGSETNIEFLERIMPTADVVVALLTPDDEGRKVGSPSLELRARQNVLIEAGYAVISKRKRSFIVAIGGVSIPSDFEGINRIQATIWGRDTEFEFAKYLHACLGSVVILARA